MTFSVVEENIFAILQKKEDSVGFQMQKVCRIWMIF